MYHHRSMRHHIWSVLHANVNNKFRVKLYHLIVDMCISHHKTLIPKYLSARANINQFDQSLMDQS